MMKHLIDPTVDCVFKAILGAQENEFLLVHFLNSVVKLKCPITSVKIQNPYNEKQQLDAKLSVVDIMAKDQSGHVYQIELQLTSPNHLTSRMSFNLSQIHGRQLVEGENYDEVGRTICIWLCTQDVRFQQSKAGPDDYDFRFVMYDPVRETLLNEDFELHVIQMNRWRKPANLQGLDEWLYFFTDAKNWSKLPKELQTEHMKRAMAVLEKFSEQKESYYQYLERMNVRTKEMMIEAESKALNDENAALTADNQALNDENAALKDETQQLSAQIENYQLKQLDNAKKLIELNTLSVEQIAEMTQLSIEDIQALVDER